MDTTGAWSASLPCTLAGMLREKAEHFPDKVAITMLGEHLTYQQIVEGSHSYARGLRDLGVDRGDVIAVFAENSVHHVYVEFAAARIGAIEVMINTAYRGEFLRHQLADCGASVVVVERSLLDKLMSVVPLLPSLKAVVVTDDASAESVGSVATLPIGALRDHSSGDLDMRYPAWSDPCAIVYTSGTTGPSKGALLSNNYLCLFAELESSLWYRGPDDAFYSTGPLYHLGAKGIGLLGAMYRGVRCVQDERFSGSNFWRRIREENCNATLMLGSVPMLLWSQPPSDLEGVDTVVGIPVPADLQVQMQDRWKCKFESAYGLSEAAPVVHTGPDVPLRPGSAGKVDHRYFDVRIFDDDDNEVPAGTAGEVVIRPKRPHSIFENYFNNPGATLERMGNCWFHTGDIGRFDDDGYFYFVDRKKDYLRRRGENISSFEVELAISSHPDVIEAAVVGVSSELGEDEVKVFVVTQNGVDFQVQEFISFCIDRMPYFAVPRYVELVDDLPRTPTGKVEKHKLRSKSNDGSWDREAAGIVLSGKRRAPLPAPADRAPR